MSLVRNFASIFAWQGMNYVLPLVTLPYLARVLQPEQFGLLGFATSLTAYAGLLTDWGFNLSATQLVAVNQGDDAALSRIFWDTILAKLGLGLVSLLLLLTAIAAVPALQPKATLLVAAWLQVAGGMITADWFLRGVELMGRFAIASSLGRILPLPLMFLLVRSPDDVVAAALLQSSGFLIAGAISLWMAIGTGHIGRPVLTLEGPLRSLRAGFYLFLSTASISLYTNLNTVVVFALAGPVQGGFFSGADKLRRAGQGLVGPIGMVMYPRIANIFSKDATLALAWSRNLLLIQGGLTLMLSVGTWIVAPLLVRIVLGPSYDGAVAVLRAMSPVLFLVGINNVLGMQMLLPLGLKKEFLLSMALPGLFSLAYMPALAYWSGATGVAVSLTVTELLVNVFAGAFLYRRSEAARRMFARGA